MVHDWIIGFDADDTLWHNERFFRLTQEEFATMLGDAAPRVALMERLAEVERRNLLRYGFGIKGFTLSMIETAIEVTDGRVPTGTISRLVELGREMLAHPIELLPHVMKTVTALKDEAQLVLVTKGDLLDQERKLAQSGLGPFFDAVEIVSDKTPEVYARVFAAGPPDRAIMVGNSLRSDVLPAIAAGAWGVHIPHELTWDYEKADAPLGNPRFKSIADLSHLPAIFGDIRGKNAD